MGKLLNPVVNLRSAWNDLRPLISQASPSMTRFSEAAPMFDPGQFA
jgi:hypothetical protein